MEYNKVTKLFTMIPCTPILVPPATAGTNIPGVPLSAGNEGPKMFGIVVAKRYGFCGPNGLKSPSAPESRLSSAVQM
jgi:hypothetical protein